jgi:hypothetical protein
MESIKKVDMKSVIIAMTLLVPVCTYASASSSATAQKAWEYAKLCAMIPECAKRKAEEDDYRKNYWKYFYQKPVVEKEKREKIKEFKILSDKMKSYKILQKE